LFLVDGSTSMLRLAHEWQNFLALTIFFVFASYVPTAVVEDIVFATFCGDTRIFAVFHENVSGRLCLARRL
jgi:hypothetical protein